jgi:hypothetical protein
MKLNQKIKLENNYNGYFADIGEEIDIEPRGFLFVVVDFDKKNINPDLNVIPCKVIHVFDPHYAWVVRKNNIVLKSLIFN